jgi:hypothetical protein
VSRWVDRAEGAYEAIRRSSRDVELIARHTGYKASNIRKVKDHLFFNAHLLDRYTAYGHPPIRARFDPDEAIAAAWHRLQRGDFGDADRQLLRHEIAEAWYMRKIAPSYDEAHNAANRRFPAAELG